MSLANRLYSGLRNSAHAIISSSDLCLSLVFIVVALGLVGLMERRLTPDQAVVVATLVGALIGAAAVFAGNWINRLNESLRAATELEARRTQMKTLITAELVDVAAGLIGAHRYIRAALSAVQSSGGTVQLDVSRYSPREMAITDRLGSDLLLLELPALDALATLRANLAITRRQMEDAGDREGGAWLTDIAGLATGVRHTIEVLAGTFAHIAPTRQLQLPGSPPELASTVLQHIARVDEAGAGPDHQSFRSII